MIFENRAALVTGGASGIGLAIARRLAGEGVDLVLADVNEGLLASGAARVREESPGVTVVTAAGDLSDRDDAAAAVRTAVDSFGRLDVLVNCAGGGVILPTDQHTEETLRRTIDRNLWTTMYVTLEAIPHMLQRGYGRVVNIGAESVRNGLYQHAVYNAAKGGVHAFATGLAREYAESGITFNTVAPSWIMTEELAARIEAMDARARADWDELAELMRPTIPMRRPGTSEEVAAFVAFVASDEASYITGQTLSVNGGSSMQ